MAEGIVPVRLSSWKMERLVTRPSASQPTPCQLQQAVLGVHEAKRLVLLKEDLMKSRAFLSAPLQTAAEDAGIMEEDASRRKRKESREDGLRGDIVKFCFFESFRREKEGKEERLYVQEVEQNTCLGVRDA